MAPKSSRRSSSKWRGQATMSSASAPARSRNGPMRCRANWPRPGTARPMAKKSCLAVRHVAFEDLGLLDALLAARGYDVRWLEAGVDPLDYAALVAPDLVVV